MDFQTMLRKVKAKQYKHKSDFRDDLELMWSNCYIYNGTEVSSDLLCFLNHPYLPLNVTPHTPRALNLAFAMTAIIDRTTLSDSALNA